MAYTESDLSVVCPKCKAAQGGKCLEKKLDGQRWIDYPHQERIEAAKRAASDMHE
jgi:hypothetical protein